MALCIFGDPKIAGGWHGRLAKEGGEGVLEMGFRAGPFVLCKDRCCRQSRRNTTFGPEKFFSPKLFTPHMCSQNHICCPPPPPTPVRQVGQPWPKPPSLTATKEGGGLGKWASVPCPPPPKAIFFPPFAPPYSILY